MVTLLKKGCNNNKKKYIRIEKIITSYVPFWEICNFNLKAFSSMDFNDINLRLERVYSSVNARIDSMVMDNVNLTHEKTISWWVISLTFDYGNNESDNLNKILMIVHNLANLKDHLKSQLKLKGKSDKNIENEINKSDFLKIILDLSNQDKHGYPLTKTRRSEKDPKILNIEKWFGIVPWESSAEFIFSPFGWGMQNINGAIYITADIVDLAGVHLYSLDTLIVWALADWEWIIKTYLK